MKATELQIGNLVYHPLTRETAKINQANLCDFANGFIFIEAIPLTEEWLVKLGFKQQGKRKMWVRGKVCVVLESYFDIAGNATPEAFYLGFKDLGNVVFHTTLKVESVHTLQNAFALTGEELILKSE